MNRKIVSLCATYKGVVKVVKWCFFFITRTHSWSYTYFTLVCFLNIFKGFITVIFYAPCDDQSFLWALNGLKSGVTSVTYKLRVIGLFYLYECVLCIHTFKYLCWICVYLAVWFDSFYIYKAFEQNFKNVYPNWWCNFFLIDLLFAWQQDYEQSRVLFTKVCVTLLLWIYLIFSCRTKIAALPNLSLGI